MQYLPASARHLAQDACTLTRDLELATGQPGLTAMQSAVGVVEVLAATVFAAVRQVSLVAEYVRAECEAGRVRATDEFPSADVTQAKVMSFRAARSAIPALEHAARALNTMQGELALLESTHTPAGDSGIAAGGRNRMTTAMDLVLARLLGETHTAIVMAQNMSNDELYSLERTLSDVVSTLASARESRM